MLFFLLPRVRLGGLRRSSLAGEAGDLGPAPHQPIIGRRVGRAFLASADSAEMVGQLARISNLAPIFATSAAAAPSSPASSGFSVSRSTGSKRLEIFRLSTDQGAAALRPRSPGADQRAGGARISCVRIIVFDDLHETGIYSWAYLHCLDVEHAKRWRAYLDGRRRTGSAANPPASSLSDWGLADRGTRCCFALRPPASGCGTVWRLVRGVRAASLCG
jgi:hypothetical protein